MRGAARGLIVALLLGSVPTASAAPLQPAFFKAVRALDGAQFLEDEPIWICDEATETESAPTHVYRLIGVDDNGRRFRAENQQPMDLTWVRVIDRKGNVLSSGGGRRRDRAREFVTLFGLPERPELHAILWTGGLRAGGYEVRRLDSDTSRVVARFRVIEPRGSELAVRAALARANRLFQRQDTESSSQATQLLEAILRRYPNTSYRTIGFLGLWSARNSARTGTSGAWLDELFAHFHDSCFGIWALDHFMSSASAAESLPRLRKLVGLYPDTRLSRAAARYM